MQELGGVRWLKEFEAKKNSFRNHFWKIACGCVLLKTEKTEILQQKMWHPPGPQPDFP